MKTPKIATDYECRLTKTGSTWGWFLENKFGGGGGSAASSKGSAMYQMLRSIKPGETFTIVVNGKRSPIHTRIPCLGNDAFETYAREMVYVSTLFKLQALDSCSEVDVAAQAVTSC